MLYLGQAYFNSTGDRCRAGAAFLADTGKGWLGPAQRGYGGADGRGRKEQGARPHVLAHPGPGPMSWPIRGPSALCLSGDPTELSLVRTSWVGCQGTQSTLHQSEVRFRQGRLHGLGFPIMRAVLAEAGPHTWVPVPLFWLGTQAGVLARPSAS